MRANHHASVKLFGRDFLESRFVIDTSNTEKTTTVKPEVNMNESAFWSVISYFFFSIEILSAEVVSSKSHKSAGAPDLFFL